ncbi:hypothetical protein O7626_25955 [Micromonospora sp. WMMD1102]|uniref:hypothetical protein n=1 Tax=Micromonospora sp. WMMD1102 TaxID=3016105 RepID=UPI002414EA1C|nr:hypothetical protein [Micromonospora sp. WMMD1102]MDG4789327.1 hypothetical protein [Micromonospora sp. WMMD1102]
MSTAVVTFRAAVAGDAEGVAALHADSWRRHYRGAYTDAFLDGDVFADRLAVWSARLADPAPQAVTVLAEVPGKAEVPGSAALSGEAKVPEEEPRSRRNGRAGPGTRPFRAPGPRPRRRVGVAQHIRQREYRLVTGALDRSHGGR